MGSRETLVKKSKKCTCALTLKQLEEYKIKTEFIDDKYLLNADTYLNLVLFSPSKQSNLRSKLSKKHEKHIDEIIEEIKTGLDVKQFYCFSSFSPNAGKEDLSDKILHDSKTFLCLYNNGSFLESLYGSIRNALAHGNIFKQGNHFFLYSVSSKGKEAIPEEERNITFLLKVHKLHGLSSYETAFEKFR